MLYRWLGNESWANDFEKGGHLLYVLKRGQRRMENERKEEMNPTTLSALGLAAREVQVENLWLRVNSDCEIEIST